MYRVEVKQTNKIVIDQFVNLKLAYDFYHMTCTFKDVVYSKLYVNDVLLEKYKKEG